MNNNNYNIAFSDREREYFLAMKRFLSAPAGKYEKLVYPYLWISCFHFHYCNDPLRTIATVLQVSTLNVAKALKSLNDKGYISKKPYMINT